MPGSAHDCKQRMGAQEPAAKFAVELEAGATWQSYNDVRIPNDSRGTRLSLRELAGSGPWASGRVYLTRQAGRRHGLRLLLAPSSLTETGVSGTPVSYAGASSAAGQAVQATCTFNSYRLAYRYTAYTAHEGSGTTAWIGFTAKLRDAVIAFAQYGIRSRKDDLGFVPLLHMAVNEAITLGAEPEMSRRPAGDRLNGVPA